MLGKVQKTGEVLQKSTLKLRIFIHVFTKEHYV